MPNRVIRLVMRKINGRWIHYDSFDVFTNDGLHEAPPPAPLSSLQHSLAISSDPIINDIDGNDTESIQPQPSSTPYRLATNKERPTDLQNTISNTASTTPPKDSCTLSALQSTCFDSYGLAIMVHSERRHIIRRVVSRQTSWYATSSWTTRTSLSSMCTSQTARTNRTISAYYQSSPQ